MEIGIAVSPLRNKLRKLLADDEISDPRLKTTVEQLLDMLESLLDILADVEDRVLPFPRLRTDILHDVYTADDSVDAFILRREVQRRGLTDQFQLNQLNHTDQLDGIISHLHKMLAIFREQLNRRLSDQIVLTGNAKQWESIPAGYFDDASYFVGRKNEIHELLKRLLGNKGTTRNSHVIPVVGVAGSGKTTLVRKIYNRVDIKKHFECRAWVHVSSIDIKQHFEDGNLSAKEKEEERNLWADIVKQVMVMTKEQRLSNEELKVRLSAFLEKKRYLIVLDGVRTKDVWDRLKKALPSNTENGSKIILTTVHADVAQQANPEGSPFQLRLLTEEESWELFFKKVTDSVAQQNNLEAGASQLHLMRHEESWPLLLKEEMPDFIHLREQVLRTCNGIPLAILLLGGLLSTIFQWPSVTGHATFGRYQSVSGILALSYRGLQSELKSCVLYMCLFPREYEIPLRRLFGLWIAEDMVKPSHGEERVTEDVAERYFSELVGRNMIEVAKWRSDGGAKACRMPGMIYDFLLPKALNMGFLHVHGKFQNSIDFKVKRCANYLDIEKYPSNIESLRSYVSSDIRRRGMAARGTGMLLIRLAGKTSLGLLMVLDLEGVYKPALPKELWKLLILRYLGLRSTVLDSLPESVGELQCLETLDVKRTNITDLPRSILKGKKLRHLYLNGINLDTSIIQQSSGPVCDLQTLSGLSIDSEVSIKNGLDRFTGLRKLVLTYHSKDMEAVVDWISKLTNLQTLKLRLVDTLGKPSDLRLEPIMGHGKLTHLYLLGVLPKQTDLRELPQNLKILTLSLSKLVDDPMPILGELRHLKTLKLLAQSYRGKVMTCNDGSFPQLRILKLWRLEELEEWRLEKGAMPCLRELEIRRCKELKRPYGLQHVSTLQDLILTNMPENFVADLAESMKRDDVFINIINWEFSSLACEFSSFPCPHFL